MNSTMLNADCIALIEEFAGFKEQWKHRFSTDVLPKIDQGWVEVAIDQLGPCSNCYLYGRSEHWSVNGVCLNCADNDHVIRDWVSFNEIKKFSNYGYLHSFEMFMKHKAAVEDENVVIVGESMLQNSKLFKEIQMLNLV